MTNLTKKLTMTGAALAAAGFIAFGETETASAATSWEARTVEEITADIEDNESGSETYTITWGDTLGNIAAALDLNLNKLVEINDINNADLIIAGTVISISADHETVTYSDTTTGETKSYNVSEEAETVEEVETPEEVVEETATETTTETTTAVNHSTSEAEAKEIIAFRESSGSYDARNGRYIGRYQLDYTYLDGDYSPANQEKVVEEYVSSRYGSWQNALTFWNENGWY